MLLDFLKFVDENFNLKKVVEVMGDVIVKIYGLLDVVDVNIIVRYSRYFKLKDWLIYD